MLSGNVLLVGGTGFLARGILRRACNENWPAKFTIYSRNEHFQAQCKARYPEATYILGDIRDDEKLKLICKFQDIVVNCAAMKYVPESENNVSECLDINVNGVRSLLSACYQSHVHTVIGISTDKAVEPANMYGLTKAIGEKLYCEMADWLSWDNKRKFVQTRYGNVIGSTGSVVPLFKHMAEQYGEVRVTDLQMTRFWLTIDEAVDLIIYARESLASGEIIIPDARACSLGTVIDAVVPDVKLNITGLRPGEKYHEKLLTAAESWKSKRVTMPNSLIGYVYNPRTESHTSVRPDLTSDIASEHNCISAEIYHDAVLDAARV